MRGLLAFMLIIFVQAGNAQKIRAGLSMPSDYDLLGVMPASSPINTITWEDCVPEVVDLSAMMPPVGNQKLQNSCVAFALGYACRSYYNVNDSNDFYTTGKRNSKAVDYSKIVSPAFIYNLLNEGDPHNAVSMEDALKLMEDTGACTFARMPYEELNWTKKPKEADIAQARDFRIETFGMLNHADLVNEIKGQLRSRQPVLVSTIMDLAYWTHGKNYEDTVPYLWRAAHNDDPDMGHAVIIVGYDDFKDAFKFMNSAGDKWGNHGFGWISYKIAPQAIRVAYVIKPQPQLKTIAPALCTEGCNEALLSVTPPPMPEKELKKEEPVELRTHKRRRSKQKHNIHFSPAASAPTQVMQPLRANNFKATLSTLQQTDSTAFEIGIDLSLKNCACDSYQVVVQLFWPSLTNNNNTGAPVISYNPAYSLTNGQAAIALDKKAFIGEDNGWQRISIPLKDLAIPKGYITDGVYKPAINHFIARAVWYNDNFPVKVCSQLPIEVVY